ncbi:hypothetical protein F5Y15DRAFT_273299 [Xylariaceae sp. FL0016]|nr:hypothetical protein F5Y15DRAFT_273299 [Xylariaceae sp. FL0016]
MALFLAFALASLATATTYSLSAFAPGTNVDGVQLDAAGQAFYAGISGPSTYCPLDNNTCPEVHGTLVYDGMTGMAVEVPGGQQIYVGPYGQVRYTNAHSSSMPIGSMIGGWFNKTILADCGPHTDVVDFLANDGSDYGGLALCPDIPDYMNETGASYALYAKASGFSLTDCIDVLGLVLIGTDADVGCWQYL